MVFLIKFNIDFFVKLFMRLFNLIKKMYGFCLRIHRGQHISALRSAAYRPLVKLDLNTEKKGFGIHSK